MNDHGNYFYHWEVHDILPFFFGFRDNLSHVKKMSLYYKEVGKLLTFYQGINLWLDGSHGYKGLYLSINTG